MPGFQGRAVNHPIVLVEITYGMEAWAYPYPTSAILKKIKMGVNSPAPSNRNYGAAVMIAAICRYCFNQQGMLQGGGGAYRRSSFVSVFSVGVRSPGGGVHRVVV